jgi:hypothetical protein
MRVTNVSLYSSSLEEPLTFSLRYSEPQGQYIVREMIGLDAEELIPKFYGSGLQTKPRFYDFGLKAREIVLRVVLSPRFNLDETYSDIRDRLYRTISSTRTGIITLHFNAGATTLAKIDGFVTKFEVPYFTEMPEAQLTITCNDPMFRAINSVRYEATELSEINPVIVPDSISTSPHGFSMELVVSSATSAFVVQDDPTVPEWKFRVVPTAGFLTGDRLYFCSEYSNRYLYMIRGGVTTHLLDKLEPTSVWPTIFPGANTFYIPPLANFNWVSLEYYAAYWGV